MKTKILLPLLVVLLWGHLLQAQTWTGTTGNDWNTATNWNNNAVPSTTDNVTIPGSGISNWPQLSSNITVAALTMNVGSQLDVNGFSVTAANSIAFNGATLNNSSSTTDIVINLPGNNETDFGGNTINDHISFNINGTGPFYEGYPSGDHFTGNASFNIGGTGTFYSAYSAACQYDGNLSITRTAGSSSTIFQNGASTVGGNFSFTGMGGTSNLGNTGNKTNIGGTVNITNTGTSNFTMYHLTNNATGGSITLQNTGGTNIQNDTLLVSNVAISGLKNGMNFTYNKISGACSLADDAANTNEIDFGGNYIGGNFTATVNGTEEFDEGYPAGNHFAGNATFNVNGTGSFYTAYSNASQYDGNLGITRTAAGTSTIFRLGNSTVGGNFSFSGMGGTVGLNANNYRINIGGMVNITNSGANDITILHLVNNTAGGSIALQNTGGTNIQNDTLLVSNVAISGLKNGMNFTYNKISGACSLADDAANTNEIDFGGNYIGGNFTATVNGTEEFDEGYPAGNHFAGNATFNVNGTGSFYTAYSNASQYDGNLGITRTAAGTSTIFRLGNSTVGGNFSFSGMGGTVGLNANNYIINIGGMVNITNSGANDITMHHLVNNTAGGSIALQNTGGTNIQNDTLLVSNVAISGLKNGMNFTYNKISGACSLADDAANTNEIDFGGNYIGGDFTATVNGTEEFDEGYPAGNHFIGNATFNVGGTGNLHTAYSAASQYDGNLSMLGANFTLNGNAFIFSGSGADTLSFSNAALAFPNITLQKTTGSSLMLAQPTAITGNVAFNGGNIISSSAHPLIFNNNATMSGGSDASHVVGIVNKYGNQAFTFPIGNNTAYYPVSISAPANSTDEFTGQYAANNPTADGYDTAQRPANIQRVYGGGYWNVERAAGTSNVTVTLGYNFPAGFVTDNSSLHVMHWNSGTAAWEDLGNTAITGNDMTGTVSTTNPVTNFSPFAIGTTDAGANPLPLSLISFTGARQGNANLLQWATGNEQNTQTFEVQRGSDGSSFSTIGKVAAIGSGGNKYSYTDASPVNGNNFYRLKMVDVNGTFVYSKVISVNDKSNNNFVVYPNPASSTLNVNTTGITGYVQIIDMAGRTLMTTSITGNKTVLNISKLAPGTYACKAGGNAVLFLKK